MNILEALDDPNLLGASIRDAESWKPWRALLAAAFGLSLSPDELALYRQCTGRTVPPGAAAAYLWLVIGRRGGKSFAMALVAIFLAVFKDWRKYLSPGERAIVLLVAADREQAKILHRYCQGILSPPILQSHVLNVTTSESEHQAAVASAAITAAVNERDHFQVVLSALDERLASVMTDALAEHAKLTLAAEYDAAERALRDIAARMRASRLGPGTIEINITHADIVHHRPAWKRLEEAWLQDPRAAPAKYLRWK